MQESTPFCRSRYEIPTNQTRPIKEKENAETKNTGSSMTIPDLVRAIAVCACELTTTEVTTASDGYGAIASAQKDRPALIILDLGLPVGDGFVVLDRFAEEPIRFVAFPVIVPECARSSG